MSEEKTLKIKSTIRKHNTSYETLGKIESKLLAQLVGKTVTEIKYIEE
jgi:hypothetical protein